MKNNDLIVKGIVVSFCCMLIGTCIPVSAEESMADYLDLPLEEQLEENPQATTNGHGEGYEHREVHPYTEGQGREPEDL